MKPFKDAARLTETCVVETRQGAGDWKPRIAVCAEKMPTMGREVAAAESTVPVVPVRWRLRYDAWIAEADVREIRLVNRGRLYNVTYIEDDGNEHVQLYIVTELMDT